MVVGSVCWQEQISELQGMSTLLAFLNLTILVETCHVQFSQTPTKKNDITLKINK
jgi:hypothetical protein